MLDSSVGGSDQPPCDTQTMERPGRPPSAARAKASGGSMPILEDTVYFLCMVTSLVCMGLLLRGWRRSRTPLLLWSAICFVLLAINNLLLFIDVVLLPDVDLREYRAAVLFAAVAVLLYGLVWETE